ncbi:hypothetical protein O181_109729 [Austropuccinia psidii MF-1]|uniref:Uncharacterized protein n=1 Tax=Austropuccinia psidii MF-1 TaxID=1389203 RepID=A0A9Q3JX09_9BASI|nr:hypothetical protein [Austropuccinia psidii MF-1]
MKEGGHVSLYIGDFRSLESQIVDWGERSHIYHSRRGLASRIVAQLASHLSNIDSLQDIMNITLELDTRYHERQKEKNNHQEKKPEASRSNSSHSQNSSISGHKKKKNFQKRDKPHSHQGKSCINRWLLTSRRTPVSIKSCFSSISVT